MTVPRLEYRSPTPQIKDATPIGPIDILNGTVELEKYRGQTINGTIANLSPRHEVDTHLVSTEDRNRLRANHNVFNEMRTIQKQIRAGLHPVYAWEYPHAQARGLISEFATGFGNETHYRIRGGKMFAPGNAISTSEALTAHALGASKREIADAKGFLRVEQTLLNTPEGTVVIQLSPPSVTPDNTFENGFGAYGFVNMFQRIGNEVVVNHIMYQEDPALSQSLKLYGALQKEDCEGKQRAPEDYIQTPVIMLQDTAADVVATLGLENEWRKYLADRVYFEQYILQDPYIRQWLHQYVIFQVKSATANDPSLALQAETVLIAAYNRARDLSSNTKVSMGESIPTQKKQVSQEVVRGGMEMFVLYASKGLHMQPGSCPVSYEAQTILSAQGFITHDGIARSFRTREFVKGSGEWLKRDCVTCPVDGCGFVSTKTRPHLYNEGEKRWVCANPQCKEHNPDIYNKVMRTV